MANPSVPQYGEMQARGILFQHWIEGSRFDPSNPSQVCPVQSSIIRWDFPHITMTDLLQSEIPPYVDEWCRDLEIVSSQQAWLISYNQFIYLKATVVNGAIFIDDAARDASRDATASAPHISELLHPIYTYEWPIAGLRHIFISNVDKNDATYNLIHQLQIDLTPRVWEYGTPQYQALLGTPLGRIVAAFIINIFPAGMQHITRIHILPQTYSRMMLRFDIMEMPAQTQCAQTESIPGPCTPATTAPQSLKLKPPQGLEAQTKSESVSPMENRNRPIMPQTERGAPSEQRQIPQRLKLNPPKHPHVPETQTGSVRDSPLMEKSKQDKKKQKKS